MSWKTAAVLGAAIFVVFAIAIPLGVEWWVYERTEDLTAPEMSRVAHSINRLFDIRFMLPMKIVGSVVAIIFWLVALWKIIAELRSRP
jgi:ABC-type Co2+ transport system permease subunit